MKRKAGRVVVLSIEPRWAEAVLSGCKQWEYRRVAPAQAAPYPMLLYATAPTSAVVGQGTVGAVRREAVEPLVAGTVSETPHSPQEVHDYFAGRNAGAALRITATTRFPRPVSLDALGISQPPQNFQYYQRA